MCVVVSREIRQPGPGVGIQCHLEMNQSEACIMTFDQDKKSISAVLDPGQSLHLYAIHLVSPLDVVDHVGAGHRVLVVVLVVLVKHGGDLGVIDPDGEQGLLVVVGGQVELEHVCTPCHHSYCQSASYL